MLLYWKPDWISRLEVQLMGNVKNAKIWGSLRVPHSDSTPGAEMGKQGSDSNWEPTTTPFKHPRIRVEGMQKDRNNLGGK